MIAITKKMLTAYFVGLAFVFTIDYLSEALMPMSHWLRYHEVQSTHAVYGAKPEFRSILVVDRPSAVRWNDIIYCNDRYVMNYESSAYLDNTDANTVDWVYGHVLNERGNCYLRSEILIQLKYTEKLQVITSDPFYVY